MARKKKAGAGTEPTESASPKHLDRHPIAQIAFSAIRDCIDRHSARLLKYPNVLEIRPGFKFTNGWITDQPAIVVVVAQKVPDARLSKNARLPKQIDGIPLDVAPATPIQQLRHAPTRSTRAMPA